MATSARWGIRKVLTICFAFSSLLLFASGCGSGGGTSPKAWTIFVYGHGDHNLTGSLVEDISKMASATLTSDVQIIVAADYDAGAKDATGANYPTGTKWYSIAGGGAKTLIREVDEQNLDEPSNLTEAVSYAFTQNELAAITASATNLLAASCVITDNDGDQYNCALIFRAGEATAQSIAYQSEEGEWDVAGVNGFATEHPGATFQPARMRVSDGTLVVGSSTPEAIPATGGVAVTMAEAASGTYYLRATSENAWSNSTSGTDDDTQIIIP